MIGAEVETMVIKTIYDGKDADRKIEKTVTSIKKLSNGMQEVQKRVIGSNGKLKSYTKTIEKQRSEFQAWALSFIFAGMQIKAVSEQITRASVGTFLKISEGNNDASRAIIGLAANFKFLQFEIGNAIGTALKPLMPILTMLIRGVAQFVEKHPELTFAAIAGAFTLGTGIFLGGQMVLFADAVVDLVNKGGGIAGVLSPFSIFKNPWVAAAIIAFASIAGLSWKAFNETPDAWNAVKGAISEIGRVFTEDLVPAIENMIKTIFPDFELNWENIAWTAAWAFRIIADGIKIIMQDLSALINGIAGVIKAFEALNSAAHLDFSSAKSSLSGAISDFSKAYSNFSSTDSSIADMFSTASMGPMRYKEINTYGGFQGAGTYNPYTNNYIPQSGPQTLINANVINVNMSQDPSAPTLFTSGISRMT